MATLLLRLAGPTQGWDVETVDVTPDRHHAATRPHQLHHLLPTATGVAGLMASALGRPRGSYMSDLLGLDYFVRVDQPGRPRVEFRTTRRRTARGIVSRPQLQRVVDDARFLVAVEGDHQLLNEIAAALTAPRWPLYLGRREYPPSEPIHTGPPHTEPADVALASHPWIAAPWHRARCADVVWLDSWRLRPGATRSESLKRLPEVRVSQQQQSDPDFFDVVASAAHGQDRF